MSLGALTIRRTEEVDCSLEIACTAEDLYAHLSLDGAEVQPGDVVLVHAAPAQIGFGQLADSVRRATILRAGPLTRMWTRLRGYFALTSLYEVSFSPARFDLARDPDVVKTMFSCDHGRTVRVTANPAAPVRAIRRRSLA